MSESIPVAARLSAVKPSATVAVAQRARELRRTRCVGLVDHRNLPGVEAAHAAKADLTAQLSAADADADKTAQMQEEMAAMEAKLWR